MPGALSKRKSKAAFIVIVALTLVVTAGAAGGVDDELSEPPSTTVPGDGDAERPVEDPREAPEVLDAAEDLGISVDEVIDLFMIQSEHMAFITPLVDHPGFVDFRGPHAEGGSLLVVEPGFESDAAFRNPPEGIRVKTADVPAAKRDVALREAEDAAKDVAGSAFWSVAYDAFDNVYKVWVEPGTLTAELGAAISTQVASRLTSNPEATVVAEEAGLATSASAAQSLTNDRDGTVVAEEAEGEAGRQGSDQAGRVAVWPLTAVIALGIALPTFALWRRSRRS